MSRKKRNSPKADRDDYKLCRCSPTCYKMLSKRTRDRHYANADVLQLQPSASELGSSPPPVAADDSELEDRNAGCSEEVEKDYSSEEEEEEDPNHILSYREHEEEEGEPGLLSLSAAEIEAELERLVGPARQQEMYDLRNTLLTDNDRDNIRAFKLKITSNMSRSTYNHLLHTFRHKIAIDSEWVILHRLAVLSGIVPQNIDCCVRSCVAFTQEYANLEKCPFCQQDRYTSSGEARRKFSYLPIIPRLQAFFQNEAKAQILLYRHHFRSNADTIRDVFDGEWYRTLLRTTVRIDGVAQPYCYFTHKYDIALGLSADSYLLFKRRRGGPSAMPILLQNFNLPPQIRTQTEHLICVGVIPGPRQPKDMGSFLVPLDDELAILAAGVPTFDAITKSLFDFHAYLLFKNGDILAIEKLLNIKGHNSFHPCRSCEIEGVRNVSGKGTVYYTPLKTPRLVHQTRPSVDPYHLKLQTHAKFEKTVEQLADPTLTKKELDEIKKQTGIRGPATLLRVGSIDYARSLPWEWMHLFLENVIPTLVDFWTGRFKGLDEGSESYQITPHIWVKIGEETAHAVPFIPAAFVCRLGNIAEDRSLFTAEAWSFWFMYVAPIVLKDRFLNKKYYNHMMLLVALMRKMVKFTLPINEVDEIEQGLTEWVVLYKKYYYQHKEERLSACTLPIHGLLHVAADIRFCGPVWTSWTFAMERFCGVLQESLRSRRAPWSTLNNRILHIAYLAQLRAKYDLEEELSEMGRGQHRGYVGDQDILTRAEYVYPNYPMQALLGPYSANFHPDTDLRRRIAIYLKQIVGGRFNQILANIPQRMPTWSKLRIQYRGDRIETSKSFNRFRDSRRDNTFVRYEIQYDVPQSNSGSAAGLVQIIQYGQLERILVCQLGNDGIWKNHRESTHLLALIVPVKTEGQDASSTITHFSMFLAPIITDLRNVKAVIGRVESRTCWGIIDRSVESAKTTFADETDDSDSSDDGNEVQI